MPYVFIREASMCSTREDSRYKNGQGTAHLGRHITLNKAVRVVYDVLKPLDLVVPFTQTTGSSQILKQQMKTSFIYFPDNVSPWLPLRKHSSACTVFKMDAKEVNI